jgi:hypothetical protein
MNNIAEIMKEKVILNLTISLYAKGSAGEVRLYSN